MKEIYVIFCFGTDCGESYWHPLFYFDKKEEAEKLLTKLNEARNKKCESIGVHITKEMQEENEPYPDGVVGFTLVKKDILNTSDEFSDTIEYDLIKWAIE